MNIIALADTVTPRPNDTTNDDRDVYLEISSTTAHCHPLQPQFLHVKGHQDQHANRPLTAIKTFNVDCDNCAKQYTRIVQQSSTAFGNPALLNAQPHVQIHGKLVCCNLLEMLQDATMLLPYHHYLKDKLHWLAQDLYNVHWKVLQSSLSYFLSDDQWHLVLFINNKLLLCASKAHPHFGSLLCPSYQCKSEDHWHFLKCHHPEHKAFFQMLKGELMTRSQCLQLHLCLFTAIWLGMVSIHMDTPYPDISHKSLPT